MRVLLALGLLTAFGLASCRCGDAGSAADGGVDAGAAAADESEGSGEQGLADEQDEEDDAGADPEDASLAEASTRFRDAAPGVDRDESGPPDPACIAERGKELSFAAAVVDERCAIDLRRAKKLRARFERAGGKPPGLRQEASPAAALGTARPEPSGRITVRLVNGGTAPLTLPLSFHNKLPAFSVLAEDDRHSVFELAPPVLELRDPGQGNRTHLARIQLAPGGIATASVAIVPTITKVLLRGAGDPCRGADAGADGGACASTALPTGHYVLHIGELLTDVEVGDPARVPWDAP